MSILARGFLVVACYLLLWNTVQVLQGAPVWLSVCLVVTLGVGVYTHGYRRIPRYGRSGKTSTVLCLRGFTYGLSPETLDRLYHDLENYLDAHPEIRIVAWDGDLCQEGSFATTLQRLMKDRQPHLQFLAFKKSESMHKLTASYTETNSHGVEMRGFATHLDTEPDCREHDTVNSPWAPSASFTVVGFPKAHLLTTGNKDYVELSFAGLTFLRQTMGHTRVTHLTMGEGPVVQDEYTRLHADAIELDMSGRRIFPDTTWVRLEAPRSK